MSDMNSVSLFSSEVFREFAKETEKQEALKVQAEENLLNDFDRLQNKIRCNAKLREHFKKIQAGLMENEEYREKADPKFVEAVMLLDLGE